MACRRPFPHRRVPGPLLSRLLSNVHAPPWRATPIVSKGTAPILFKSFVLSASRPYRDGAALRNPIYYLVAWKTRLNSNRTRRPSRSPSPELPAALVRRSASTTLLSHVDLRVPSRRGRCFHREPSRPSSHLLTRDFSNTPLGWRRRACDRMDGGGARSPRRRRARRWSRRRRGTRAAPRPRSLERLRRAERRGRGASGRRRRRASRGVAAPRGPQMSRDAVPRQAASTREAAPRARRVAGVVGGTW